MISSRRLRLRRWQVNAVVWSGDQEGMILWKCNGAPVRVQMSVNQLPLTQYNKQHDAAQVLDPKMRVLVERTTDRGLQRLKDGRLRYSNNHIFHHSRTIWLLVNKMNDDQRKIIYDSDIRIWLRNIENNQNI